MGLLCECKAVLWMHLLNYGTAISGSILTLGYCDLKQYPTFQTLFISDLNKCKKKLNVIQCHLFCEVSHHVPKKYTKNFLLNYGTAISGSILTLGKWNQRYRDLKQYQTFQILFIFDFVYYNFIMHKHKQCLVFANVVQCHLFL